VSRWLQKTAKMKALQKRHVFQKRAARKVATVREARKAKEKLNAEYASD
jgi:hypothetical protein